MSGICTCRAKSGDFLSGSTISNHVLILPGALPTGSIVAPVCGLYLGSYKVIPKRSYYGAYGW